MKAHKNLKINLVFLILIMGFTSFIMKSFGNNSIIHTKKKTSVNLDTLTDQLILNIIISDILKSNENNNLENDGNENNLKSIKRRRLKISKNIFGDTEVQDNYGNKTTIGKNIFGETEIKDNKDNKTTIRKNIFGDTEIEDSKGNKTTIKKNIFGDTEIEDSKGNKTTIKKNIFGDIEIEN